MSDDSNNAPPHQQITAIQDLIAGGVAGSASVIVGEFSVVCKNGLFH